MQRQAADDLKRLVTNALVERNLLYEGAQSFVTPRRLALHVVGLPGGSSRLARGAQGPAGRRAGGGHSRLSQERGPQPHRGRDGREGPEEGRVLRRGRSRSRGARRRTSSPRSCLRSSAPFRGRSRCGGARPRRGPIRCAGCARCAGSSARSPRSTMRRRSSRSTIDGLAAGDTTWGHRFMAPQPIMIRRYDDYVEALQKAKVVLDADRRKAIILADAQSLAFARGLELDRGRGPPGGSRRAGRMAGRADGRIRGGVSRPAARGDPRHHPRQSEVLRASRRRGQAR